MRLLHKLRTRWEKIQTTVYQFLGRNYKCGCGHVAKWKTVLTVHGDSGVFTLPSRKPDYCSQCWAEAAIKCAWCEGTIVPGDAITLYTPSKKGFNVPEHAVIYRHEPHLQLVGCLRWNCADTGVDRTGFWIMPGKVQRAMSPIEELMARGGTEPICVNNVTDSQEAILISDETPER